MSTPTELAAALRERADSLSETWPKWTDLAAELRGAAALLDRLAAAEKVCEAAYPVRDNFVMTVKEITLSERLAAWEALRT